MSSSSSASFSHPLSYPFPPPARPLQFCFQPCWFEAAVLAEGHKGQPKGGDHQRWSDVVMIAIASPPLPHPHPPPPIPLHSPRGSRGPPRPSKELEGGRWGAGVRGQISPRSRNRHGRTVAFLAQSVAAQAMWVQGHVWHSIWVQGQMWRPYILFAIGCSHCDYSYPCRDRTRVIRPPRWAARATLLPAELVMSGNVACELVR